MALAYPGTGGTVPHTLDLLSQSVWSMAAASVHQLRHPGHAPQSRRGDAGTSGAQGGTGPARLAAQRQGPAATAGEQ